MNAEVGKRHIYDTDTLTTTNTDINRKSNKLSYKSKKKKSVTAVMELRTKAL